MNGRRLLEVADWVGHHVAEFQRWSRRAGAGDCEGSEEWASIVRNLAGRVASELRATFKYFKTVPWFLRTSCSIEVAKECVAQIDKQPLENHDPLTQDFVKHVGNDLRSRALGGDLTEALERRVKRFKWANLNESCG